MAREIPQPATAKGQIYKLLNTPDTCPRCNTGIEPIVRGDAAIWKKDNNHQLDVAMECPKCLRLFIGIYEFSSSGTFSWNHSAPQSPQRREFRKIASLSPLFVKIYNEAKAAEAHSLSEIAGVGYRKAP